FIADVADVVITQVIIDADPRGRAESEQKSGREVERAGRKIESDLRIEMSYTGQDHSAGCEQRADPEADRDFAYARDLTVEQRDVDQADDDGHGVDFDPSERRRELRRLPDVIKVLREPDVTRSDLQRPADDELPDEEESHQPPEGFAPEAFAQVDV